MREQLIDILDIRDESTSDDDIIRRVKAMRTAYTRSVEREELAENRFRALAKIAGPEAAKRAREENPSESQMKLLRMIDPEGSNFLNSGMSAKEFTTHRRIIEYEKCISSQMNDESSRRMNLIIELAVEYDRICKEDTFGTAWLRCAMADIIDGKDESDFDESIVWMLRFGNLEDSVLDEDEQHRVERLSKLWAPAVAICREFTGIHKRPPEDRPRYDSWQEMIEGEGGLFKSNTWRYGDVWHDERDRKTFESGIAGPWRARFGQPDEFIEELFNMDVRWRGPRSSDESGYWHREDGELFPYDRESFFGNDQFRFYRTDTLRNWLYHQKSE